MKLWIFPFIDRMVYDPLSTATRKKNTKICCFHKEIGLIISRIISLSLCICFGYVLTAVVYFSLNRIKSRSRFVVTLHTVEKRNKVQRDRRWKSKRIFMLGANENVSQEDFQRNFNFRNFNFRGLFNFINFYATKYFSLDLSKTHGPFGCVHNSKLMCTVARQFNKYKNR